MIGFDAIIVATNLSSHEEYWQKRLKSLEGILYKQGAAVITFAEEASQTTEGGLCPLYVYQKAREKGKFKYHLDLFEMQQQGAAIALYLTIGAKKELFPLLASEHNDLGALLLPGIIGNTQITFLETLLIQSAPLAKGRGGRLSVFHCDQLFIPAKPYPLFPTQHLEFFGCLNTCTPSAFSLSYPLTLALLREFREEFEKKEKRSFEAPFWAPLVYDQKMYQKKFSSKDAQKNYHKMQQFKKKFFHLHSSQIRGKMAVEHRGFTWNYNTAKSYYDTSLKLTSSCVEGQLMRLFYQIEERKKGNVRIIVDPSSCLIDCNIQSGSVIDSVLIGVQAETIEVKDCVIVNSQFSSLKAHHSLLYRVEEKDALKLDPGTIRADANIFEKKGEPKKHIKMYSHLEPVFSTA